MPAKSFVAMSQERDRTRSPCRTPLTPTQVQRTPSPQQPEASSRLRPLVGGFRGSPGGTGFSEGHPFSPTQVDPAQAAPDPLASADLDGVHACVAEYAAPLLRRLRGPQADWPAAEDFAKIPNWPAHAVPRPAALCFSEIASLGSEKADLDAAGSRLLPSCCSALPVEVALLCLSRCTGFPDKLVHQVWSTMLAACLHIDMQVELKATLSVTPRVPCIGIAAPGSKKTPVQQELIHRVFCDVMDRMPFLAHNSASAGERLLFDGGSTAGFVKQLKQNSGYIYLVVEELVSFFDASYASSGATNTGQHVAPSTLLPLRTGNGLGKALSSDLSNRVDRTQAAISMMAQEDVIRKFFCAKGMSAA